MWNPFQKFQVLEMGGGANVLSFPNIDGANATLIVVCVLALLLVREQLLQFDQRLPFWRRKPDSRLFWKRKRDSITLHLVRIHRYGCRRDFRPYLWSDFTRRLLAKLLAGYSRRPPQHPRLRHHIRRRPRGKLEMGITKKWPPPRQPNHFRRRPRRSPPPPAMHQRCGGKLALNRLNC